MDIKFFLNDYYEVLKLLCENEGPVRHAVRLLESFKEQMAEIE